MEKKETFAQAISDILIKHKVIDAAQARALHRSFKYSEKDQFDDFLLDQGLIDEADLLKALAEYYQVPAVDVTGYYFDSMLLRNFPKDFLLRNRIIPLEIDEDVLLIAAADVNNQDLLEELGKYTSKDIQFRVGLARDITDSIKEFYDKSTTDLMEDDDYLHEKEIQEENIDEWLDYEEEDLE